MGCHRAFVVQGLCVGPTIDKAKPTTLTQITELEMRGEVHTEVSWG